MDIRKLLELQTQRGAKAYGGEIIKKTIDVVISDCRKDIHDKSDRYRDLSDTEKKRVIREIIVSYVMDRKPIVDGYVDENNSPQLNKLVDKLVEAITDYDFLTPAMLDPDIFEIRCNGRYIKVERKGKIEDLTDKDGNILYFDSVEQQDIIMRKMLGDVRLTPKDKHITSTTIEGYRIAATHSSALSPDPSNPNEDRYHAFVLRKFKKEKPNLTEIVRSKALSDNMARLLALAPNGGLTVFCAGPTSSGKTTLLNAILQAGIGNRIIVLQDTSEIDLRKKDASGRIVNDVLHIEANNADDATRTTSGTMANCMVHTLRLSPVDVCVGETRSNEEFAQGMMIMGAGHPLYTSLHAETSRGVMGRYLRAYMAASGESIDTALPALAELVNLIVVKKFMRDGTRKVLQVTEVVGVNPNNYREALLNDLYIFERTGKTLYDSNGSIIDIPGRHRRVGKLSERTLRKMSLEGIDADRLDFILKDIDGSEIEEYTGNNIFNYGM